MGVNRGPKMLMNNKQLKHLVTKHNLFQLHNETNSYD